MWTRGVGEGRGGRTEFGEWHWHPYATTCKINGWWEGHREPSWGLCEDPEGWRGGGRRGYKYTDNWFTLLYSRNKHNIIKQLYSNKKDHAWGYRDYLNMDHILHGGRLVTKSCLTFHFMDCIPPGSNIHGILQARILEWVAISFSRGSSQARNWTRVSCIAGRVFTNWVTNIQILINFLRVTMVSCLCGKMSSFLGSLGEKTAECLQVTLKCFNQEWERERR